MGTAWMNSDTLINILILNLPDLGRATGCNSSSESKKPDKNLVPNFELRKQFEHDEGTESLQGFPLMPGVNPKSRTPKEKHVPLMSVSAVPAAGWEHGVGIGEFLERRLRRRWSTRCWTCWARCPDSARCGCHLGPLSRAGDDALHLQSSGFGADFLGRVPASCSSPLPICLSRGWGIPCSAGRSLHVANCTSSNCCH